MAEQALVIFTPEAEKERLTLLANYHPQDHLAKWLAFDKASGRKVEVVYYPAAWRLYELNLRYPLANFDCEIVHMNEEKDFVIVRARLYLGADYQASPKRAQAYKQGKLSELDRVETKAKARAARDFGIGTEHALDMDEAESDAVNSERASGAKVNVVEADKPALPAPQDVSVDDFASPEHQPATSEQIARIRKGCKAVGKPEPITLLALRYLEAESILKELAREYGEKKASAGAGR